MPFLGRDWRSPGEQWVRSKQGWENLRLWRVKLFENLNENILARIMKLALSDWCVIRYNYKPHVPYIRGSPQERRIPMSLAEVFIRLDIAGAVRDIQRFNYVNCNDIMNVGCEKKKIKAHTLRLYARQTMSILLGSKLAGLSGTAQRHVLNILEHMLKHCISTGTNINCVDKLLESANNVINDYHDTYVGCETLWASHKRYVSKLRHILDTYVLVKREEDGGCTISELPDECLYKILSTMSDHRDIVHTGMTTSFLNIISEDLELWKRLALFHFTHFQLMTFLPKETRDDNINWKNLYRRCMRRYGQKNVFADMIAMCCLCDTVFWQSHGHPCLAHETPKHTVLSPEQFVDLLSH